ncbi:uncharacterized protein LACBIDRAFT_314395 [Laccaria bicolor S238N-H82]|uniref:Predicted protein n=1 Tax=Laccaria bicolor (strain S238N-H82 / ATCC MYA-4686) TaxID=486041 RepID=B0DYG6_LACBS|nr:uncharacterized protein LACBIDRAFT_314395 [Laccaria bicolor S238N-H82]EDR00382.1 predicted protein [Laccaria bicolor S238N-H82]|eukprot:XP_001888941.1 predicted protein [Laccaria bicolor S238N-H82]
MVAQVPLQTSYPLGRRDARADGGQTSEPTTHSRLLAPLSNGPIILPGSATLLTLLTHQILTIHLNLILADKLVPQGVLNLISNKAELTIAKKSPGNADKSQEEMMHLTEEGAPKGVVRRSLKTRRSLYIRPRL